MSFKAIIFSMFVGAALLTFGNSSVQAQGGGVTLPIWVWYVERDAVHLSGATWTSTRGPYNTQEEALAVKEQLDQDRFQGSTGFSVARVYSAFNPVFLQTLIYSRNRLIYKLPFLTRFKG